MKFKIGITAIFLLSLAGCLPQQEEEASSSGGGGAPGTSQQSVELPAATPPPVSENDEPPVVNTAAGPVLAPTETTAPVPEVEVHTYRGTSN